METGIIKLSIVAVRSKPLHESEQTTQLLFGEIYTVEEVQKNWIRIKIQQDNYMGWIHEKQHTVLSQQAIKQINNSEKFVAGELVQTITNQDKGFPILIGSTLYDFDGMNFHLGKEKYIYTGKVIQLTDEKRTGAFIKKIALKFLNAPYLWGGKSPFGIDCSGLTQIVFKICGINLLRDTYQQAGHGKTLNFIHEANEGDLAFFTNEEGKIAHVGIIINEKEIIHASGTVRIDTIDHFGIFNKDLKQYTHKLRLLKRLI